MVESWKFLRFWKYHYKEKLDRLTASNIYPPLNHRFQALELTPFDKVKVVILGQDPYPTKGMAHGLAFSVQPHHKLLPPSLRNILKEYSEDLLYPYPSSGDLRAWAGRGVLLLNTILTVEEGKPLSHKGLGWEKLTYEIIRSLADSNKVVFLLWGKRAQDYTAACGICPVVCSPHPSPLAKGFLGSKPFSRCNEALKKLGLEPIDWRLQ